MSDQENNFKIGYLIIDEIGDNNELAGSILVVDCNGYPKEIKCTETVKTSTIQRIAYGIMLRAGVMIDQIALPLIKELEEEPDIVLVNDKKLLNIQKKTNLKIALLQDDNTETPLNFLTDDRENGKIIEVFNSSYLVEDKSEPFERVYKALEFSINQKEENF